MREAGRRTSGQNGPSEQSARARRFMRFLAAGGINTLFGLVVYSVAILSGADTWLGLLAATFAGTLFNFLTVGGYVFRQLALSKLPAFASCYLAVYGINLALIEGLQAWLGGKILTQAVLAVPMAILSYFLMSRLIFAKAATSGP